MIGYSVKIYNMRYCSKFQLNITLVLQATGHRLFWEGSYGSNLSNKWHLFFFVYSNIMWRISVQNLTTTEAYFHNLKS